jgi:acyl carrier protein
MREDQYTMDKRDIGITVSTFIRKNFLFDEHANINEKDSLLGTGTVDSTGILELICYLETTYKLKFQDDELIADNFDSIERISDFICRKLS